LSVFYVTAWLECLSSSSLLGSRIASITDRGNLGRPPVVPMEPSAVAVGVGPHTVRALSAPVGPGPLQLFPVDSRLLAVADSERPGRHGRWRAAPAALDPWRERITKLQNSWSTR